MKLALFGCGSGLELFLSMNQYEVVAVFDNSVIHSDSIKGIPLLPPEQIFVTEFERLIITSRHYVEIYNQLNLLGVEKDKIQIFLPLINF